MPACCRRRNASTRRRPRRGNVGTAKIAAESGEEEQNNPQTDVDPLGGHLLHIERLPPQNMTKKDVSGAAVPCAVVQVDEAVVMPSKGKTALKRVFLGVGWRTKEKVDVDCCCAPYQNGERSDEDTVWYGNLNSSVDQGYCFTKHSGDILIGQGGDGPLEDLERLYVDLENCPVNYDCLAFEANIYTAGYTFGALDSCYIRLVNADTNQEILRCDLGKDAMSGSLGEKRVVLLAKLFRGNDRWVLHSAVEGRNEEIRKLSGTQPDMILPGSKTAEKQERAAAPVAQGMDRGGEAYAVAAQPNQTKSARKPRRSYLAPAMAVGTAAGVAAAVAIFKPEALSMQGMQNAGAGADFGDLIEIFQGTDCGICNDIDCLGLNIGESAGGVCDFFCQGGCLEMVGCDGLSEGLGCIGQPLLSCLGTIVYEVGEICTGGCDGCGDVCGPLLEGPAAICGVCGGAAEGVGGAAEDVGGAVSGAVGGCGGAVSGCAETVGSCGSGVCDCVGGILGALLGGD